MNLRCIKREHVMREVSKANLTCVEREASNVNLTHVEREASKANLTCVEGGCPKRMTRVERKGIQTYDYVSRKRGVRS